MTGDEIAAQALEVFEARVGRTQEELAELFGLSRSAVRRRLDRAWRERTPWWVIARACEQCGSQLPLTSTRRRRFCDDYCRVTFARRARRDP
ncbi:MAG TPA: sigma factor-like helix-turn-helix DNA-binding protein [Gaiellaceae bacterium]|jgi:hypothetical protein